MELPDLHPGLSVTLQALSNKLTCMHQPEMVDVRLSNYPESMRQVRQLKSSTIGEQSSPRAALLLCASKLSRTQKQPSSPSLLTGLQMGLRACCDCECAQSMWLTLRKQAAAHTAAQTLSLLRPLTCAGKLATIKGTVVRMSPIRPLITGMAFTCSKCGGEVYLKFKEGIYATPTSCGLEGCRSKAFTAKRSSATSMDWQKLRVQVTWALALRFAALQLSWAPSA